MSMTNHFWWWEKRGDDGGALLEHLKHFGEKYGQDSILHKPHNSEKASNAGGEACRDFSKPEASSVRRDSFAFGALSRLGAHTRKHKQPGAQAH
jgi:hypothetical protein